MKILAVSHLFPTLGDARYGIFVARQLSGMHQLGAEITVIVPRVWCPRFLRRFDRWKHYDHTAALGEFAGLDTVAVPFLRPPGNWFNRWAGLSVFEAIKRRALSLHRTQPFDLIYASDFFPDGDAAVRLSRFLGIPAACLGIGVDVNDTPHSSAALYRHFAATARALDGTLACGQSVADGIRAVTGTDPLIVFGVLDLDEFSPVADRAPLRRDLGLPADGIVALYGGYLDRRKGVIELVEAMNRVVRQHDNALLVLCGGGPEERALRARVGELGIEASVRFNGEVAPERMRQWMQASDLFVLASYTEGVPNVVLEAMACGLPVVATAVGGVPGAVADSDGALLVPPRDVDALTAAIMTIIGDDALRRRMGVTARRRAEERFGVARNARRILDYLGTIVAEKRAAG